MRTGWIMAIICLFVVSMTYVSTCPGGDLDDGISKYTDGSISKADEIGKLDLNINFIILNAMTKAKKNQKNDKDGKSITNTGETNENSIVVGPGTVINGDIINIIKSNN